MNILYLGDTHFGARRDSITFQNYFESFFNDTLIPYIIANDITTVIQFGDLFDNRKATNTRTLSVLKRVLIDPLKKLGVEMYIICGNHDLFHKQLMQPNSLREHLSHYDHIHIADTPQTIKVDGTAIDLIPWICSDNRDEISEFISKSKSKICCGHFELRGFSMMKGMKNDRHGDASGFLKNYDAVYSGHYHTSSSHDNITYLGTPYEINWSDCNDDKGFYNFDTKSCVATFIQNPNKLHHKILYNDKTNLIDIKKFDFNYYKESFIKVIIEERGDIPHFEKLIEALWKHSAPLDISITDISVSYRDCDIENIETQDPLTALMTTIDDDLEIMKGLDVAYVKQLATEIYQTALIETHEGVS